MTSAIVDLDSLADDDFYQISDDIIIANEKIVSVPDTILQYKARSKSNRNVSIFDPDPDLANDGMTYFCPGRGRGSVSKVFRPGQPFNYSTNGEEDIKRLLTKYSVYRNEAIELRIKNAKKKSSSPKQGGNFEFCDAFEETDEIKLTKVNSSSESSPLTVNSDWPSLEKKKTLPKKNLVTPPLSVILKPGREEANMRRESAKSSLNPSAPEFCYASSSKSKESKNGLNNSSKVASGKDKRLNRRQQYEETSWRKKEDDRVFRSPPQLRSPRRETHKTNNSPFNDFSSTNSSSIYLDDDVVTVSDSSDESQYRQAITLGRKIPAKSTFNIRSTADFPTLP